ncbi:52 kDa repressor of the inhibitor of the protein kinase-like [Melanaphis sacchari]|uniref:52 kDa repressor of the inhibitor of the protein kinase-like n=1 Tax=Melanaphis sacchari TaxID=742174 RepID=UPI000DC13826|nr:52 kDa repressor of the inhibitor of the protein kinase-like [Melanaphis sacchari]
MGIPILDKLELDPRFQKQYELSPDLFYRVNELGLSYLRYPKDNAWSQKLGGAFCRICVLFGSDEGSRSRVKLGKLVTIPLSLYKKAKENFKAHQNNDYHKNCVFKSDNFISVMNGKIQNIETTLDTAMTRKVEQNRQKLIPIIETILFCGLQNISLRGHRDDGSIYFVDDNIKNQKGNFKALLEFRINAGDQILKEHFKSATKNTTFITDKTTDVSISEQFSFCVRYFDSNTCSIREHFLRFTKVEHLTGEYLADTIIQILKEKNLDLALLRGQGYDGAANMSGAFKGVQSRIASLQPLAFYTHCANHRLNLMLSKASTVPSIRNTVGIITNIYNFLRESALRTQLLSEKISELFPHQKAVKAKKLCETRWVERHDGILHFLEILPAIIVTLNELSLSNHTGSNAQSLSAAIYDKILNAAQTYEADLPHSIEALRGELNLWKQFWKNKPEKADSSMEAFKYASMFPNMKYLLTILSVIPITTTSAERSFSSLKRIKTYLRSTMGQERLNGLAMLHINKDIQVKPREVLDVFAKKHKRKLQFDL